MAEQYNNQSSFSFSSSASNQLWLILETSNLFHELRGLVQSLIVNIILINRDVIIETVYKPNLDTFDRIYYFKIELQTRNLTLRLPILRFLFWKRAILNLSKRRNTHTGLPMNWKPSRFAFEYVPGIRVWNFFDVGYTW